MTFRTAFYSTTEMTSEIFLSSDLVTVKVWTQQQSTLPFALNLYENFLLHRH